MKESAYKLNINADSLNEILVLHLEGGKDIFITVTGKNCLKFDEFKKNFKVT